MCPKIGQMKKILAEGNVREFEIFIDKPKLTAFLEKTEKKGKNQHHFTLKIDDKNTVILELSNVATCPTKRKKDVQ